MVSRHGLGLETNQDHFFEVLMSVSKYGLEQDQLQTIAAGCS